MPYTPASIVAVPRSYEVRHGSMAQVLGNLVTAGPGDNRIVPVTAGYSWEPGAETRTPSNTCFICELNPEQWGMSLSSKFTNSSSKQVMESYYSCNQRYAPLNPTPYQPHDLRYDAYQSYGFGDAYYGYEDPSPPYPPSQKGIEEVIQLLSQERKKIREILEQIANQVDTLCSIINSKGVEIVHFASSEATPPKLPSELHFKWVNPYDMNCLDPQRYGLIEKDGQLKALCGVLDKKKMESMELNESKFKGCNGLLHKLHNNKAKIGWANRVWDPRKSSMDHHWEVTHCMGALRSLNPPGHTNVKHWWGFKDEFKHKPP
ncbi:hypothetical protein PIB30_009424 [Stylosanthes scabra]|uniref:Uncharacterized protein n=1 Tax=Stylosanthes scabra TaxID=79078 RepID=A0ABU6W6C4_9FABA|nr:hypothetical protein [Stylosanthes scabra]